MRNLGDFFRVAKPLIFESFVLAEFRIFAICLSAQFRDPCRADYNLSSYGLSTHATYSLTRLLRALLGCGFGVAFKKRHDADCFLLQPEHRALS